MCSAFIRNGTNTQLLGTIFSEHFIYLHIVTDEAVLPNCIAKLFINMILNILIASGQMDRSHPEAYFVKRHNGPDNISIMNFEISSLVLSSVF